MTTRDVATVLLVILALLGALFGAAEVIEAPPARIEIIPNVPAVCKAVDGHWYDEACWTKPKEV